MTHHTFFTADTHFGHKMLVDSKFRPFSSVEEMDEVIIERWNKMIRSGDTVYHLGDFSFHDHAIAYLKRRQLNGRIHLIQGNHDRLNSRLKDEFEWVRHYYEVKSIGSSRIEHKIILCHYPFET